MNGVDVTDGTVATSNIFVVFVLKNDDNDGKLMEMVGGNSN